MIFTTKDQRKVFIDEDTVRMAFPKKDDTSCIVFRFKTHGKEVYFELESYFDVSEIINNIYEKRIEK